MQHLLLALCLLALQVCFGVALNSIGTSRGKFVNKASGAQFNVVGVVYIVTNSTTDDQDSLSNPDACLRDAALFQQIGINTIGVTALSTTANHDLCMSIFNSVGIYVAVGLEPYGGVWQGSNPVQFYQPELMNRTFALVDAFKDYENTLLFSVNEYSSTFQGDYGNTQPVLRAVVRDVKQYVRQNARRSDIPVGHSMSFAFLHPSLEPISYEYISYGLDYSTCSIDGTPEDPSRPDFIASSHYAVIPNNNTQNWADQRDSLDYFSPSFDTFRGVILNDKQPNVPLFLQHYRIVNNFTKTPSDNFITTGILHQDALLSRILSGGLILGWANSVSAKLTDWGVVALDREGNLQFRVAYQKWREVLDQVSIPALTSGQLVSNTPNIPSNITIPSCVPKEAAPSISDIGLGGASTVYTFANAWNLPTPPSGVEDWIASGVGGRVGRHVDVTNTAVRQTIRDMDGNVVSGLAITPSPSASRGGGSPDGDSNGGNLGLKVGLGVAIPIIVIGAVIGVLFFLRRRKRQNNAARVNSGSELETEKKVVEMPGEAPAEMPQYGAYDQERTWELPDSPPDAKYRSKDMQPVELEANAGPSELAPASPVRAWKSWRDTKV